MVIFLDFAYKWQKGFQDAASPLMEALIDLHNYIFFFLIIILFFVIWMLFTTLVYHYYISEYFFRKNHSVPIVVITKAGEKKRRLDQEVIDEYREVEGLGIARFIEDDENYRVMDKYKLPGYSLFFNKDKDLNNKYRFRLLKKWKNRVRFKSMFNIVYKIASLNKISHNHLLEIIWTIIPSIVLVVIAIPSFILLYSIDEVINPAITLKAIGHQWYWSYEYSDYFLKLTSQESLNFDSYMIPEDELEKGDLRLLEVDNVVALPINTYIRVIVTSSDVLHAWSVPSLGVKIDAVPGRLNQASIYINRLGIYYGQCSEICGVYHGFMPIVIEGLNMGDYISWILSKLELN